MVAGSEKPLAGVWGSDSERPLASPSPTPCLSGVRWLLRLSARGAGQSHGEETHVLLPPVLGLGG